MFGGSHKREITRTRVSLGERVASVSILGLIGVVGVAVYLKGQSYDPGLFALDEASLAGTAPSPAPGGLRLATTDGFEADLASTADPAGLLDGLVPAGWQPLGSAEVFDAGSLYEKINGHAELYLAHNFRRLTCQSLIEPEGQFIDIYVYRMDQSQDAAGIFSAQRAPGQPDASLGDQGYRAESSFFFWKGRHYVQILASDRTETLRLAAVEIARLLESRLEGEDGEHRKRGEEGRRAAGGMRK